MIENSRLNDATMTNFIGVKVTYDVTLTRDELQSKSQGSQLTSEDIDQIIQNQENAEKYNQLKAKLKEIEDDSYLIDRLEACDHSDAPKVLREFLESK